MRNDEDILGDIEVPSRLQPFISDRMIFDREDPVLQHYLDDIFTRFCILDSRNNGYVLSLHKVAEWMTSHEATITALQDKIHGLESLSGKNMSDLTTKLSAIVKEKDSLRLDLSQKNGEVNTLAQQLKATQEHLTETQKALDDKEHLLADSEKKVKELEQATQKEPETADAPTDIFEVLGEYGPSTATEIARILHKDPSNIHKSLKSYVDWGWVKKTRDGHYQLPPSEPP